MIRSEYLFKNLLQHIKCALILREREREREREVKSQYSTFGFALIKKIKSRI